MKEYQRRKSAYEIQCKLCQRVVWVLDSEQEVCMVCIQERCIQLDFEGRVFIPRNRSTNDRNRGPTT